MQSEPHVLPSRSLHPRLYMAASGPLHTNKRPYLNRHLIIISCHCSPPSLNNPIQGFDLSNFAISEAVYPWQEAVPHPNHQLGYESRARRYDRTSLPGRPVMLKRTDGGDMPTAGNRQHDGYDEILSPTRDLDDPKT
ncbi:hypothetical protein J3458_002064 [Metarhizium acridum]|uniref:uncharacterized protein n=1 Tax=Metarhizium acridum TaxID=92637 RepID=UPI001C6CF3DF|nr:hypothetical protein J3458_002064 [Metarhizium acridum]